MYRWRALSAGNGMRPAQVGLGPAFRQPPAHSAAPDRGCVIIRTEPCSRCFRDRFRCRSSVRPVRGKTHHPPWCARNAALPAPAPGPAWPPSPLSIPPPRRHRPVAAAAGAGWAAWLRGTPRGARWRRPSQPRWRPRRSSRGQHGVVGCGGCPPALLCHGNACERTPDAAHPVPGASGLVAALASADCAGPKPGRTADGRSVGGPGRCGPTPRPMAAAWAGSPHGTGRRSRSSAPCTCPTRAMPHGRTFLPQR